MQINKPKLLGITLIHVLLLTVVLGITAAIARPAQKESFKVVDKISTPLSDTRDMAGSTKSTLSTF